MDDDSPPTDCDRFDGLKDAPPETKLVLVLVEVVLGRGASHDPRVDTWKGELLLWLVMIPRFVGVVVESLTPSGARLIWGKRWLRDGDLFDETR